jgi:probable phosphoglycerate mutase
MTTIYLIRHAEAEGNLYRRVQGHYNGKITSRGHQQIEALAKRFEGIPIQALYSSDLSRTIETAGAILRHHDLTLHTTDRLREVYMGRWEGQPWGNIQEQEPEQIDYFANDPARWTGPGNEPFDILTDRMTSVLLDIAAQHDGETVAVVSHGMAIRALLAKALGIPSQDIRQISHGDNTAVSLLEVENGVIRPVFVNDNSHLGDQLSTLARQSWWKRSSGMDPHNLGLYPIDPEREKDLYISCYRDAWISVHGDDRDFNGLLYWERAIEHHATHPEAVARAMCGKALAGLVDLDPRRGAGEGVGWISLCYITPDYRGQHLGIQLIGHAVAVYRALGRTVLRLHVAEENTRAITFYQHCGFTDLPERYAAGSLRAMELAL